MDDGPFRMVRKRGEEEGQLKFGIESVDPMSSRDANALLRCLNEGPIDLFLMDRIRRQHRERRVARWTPKQPTKN